MGKVSDAQNDLKWVTRDTFGFWFYQRQSEGQRNLTASYGGHKKCRPSDTVEEWDKNLDTKDKATFLKISKGIYLLSGDGD